MSKWSKIGFLIAVLAVVVLFVMRIIIGGWVNWFWTFFAVAGVAVAAAIIIDWRLYVDFLTMRTTKHGANMGVLILMSLALVVASNYLGFRFNKSIDLTEEKLNSLSDQTQRVLDSLNDDLTFTVFYTGTELKDQRQQMREDLSMYSDYSRKVKLRFIDAYEQPAMAKDYLQDKRVPFAVFAEYKGRRIMVEEPYSETAVTSAIVKATREKPKTIYFVTGHDEVSIDGAGQFAMSELRKGIEDMSFQIATLNLVTDKMPTDDGVIAIIGPRTGFVDSELEALRKYVRNGGRLLIAIDPGMRHNLANLTRSFGIEFKNNFVLTEQMLQMRLGLTTIGAQYDPNADITRHMPTGQMLTIFHEASELSQAPEAPKGWTFRMLVRSEGRAVVINDRNQKEVNSDAKARVLAMQVDAPVEDAAKSDDKEKKEETKRQSSVVVIGDSDLFTDRWIMNYGNRDLALNVIAGLAREAELTGIRPKQPKGSKLELTRPKMIGIISAGVSLPIVLLVAAGFFWYRRRHL